MDNLLAGCPASIFLILKSIIMAFMCTKFCYFSVVMIPLRSMTAVMSGYVEGA